MSDNNRFARQERLSQIGLDGQKLIHGATVAIIGVGALGCVSAEWLCRAGVGKLILIDRDIVNLSNLQRQTLFDEADVENRLPKAIAAANRLRLVNAQCEVVAHCVDLAAHNIQGICESADVLVDGCDNFYTRYLTNDFSVKHNIDYVYAGAVSTYGMLALLQPPGACLRCVFPEPPPTEQVPTCSSHGVLGPAIGVIGSLAANLALQSICKAEIAQPFINIDLWPFRSQLINATCDTACECCVKHNYRWLDHEQSKPVATANCDNTEVHFSGSGFIDLMQLGEKYRGSLDDLRFSTLCLQFVEDECEIFVFSDRSIHVYNCESIERATLIITNSIGAL